jgi:alpha-D-xyloside xylohydrolase
VPWLFDEEAVDVLRFFTRLKCRLMPYLFGAAREAHAAGVPVMRAMWLEFPGQPACDYLDRQYMLGDSLLVAPIFTPDGTVDYYLPAGRWTNFLSGQVVQGDRWVRERHDYLSLPLMARPNTIIPTGATEHRPDYDYADGVTFHVFEPKDGAALSASVPTAKGGVATTVEVSREGPQIRAHAPDAAVPWRVLLRGIGAIQTVEGGTPHANALGTLVVPEQGARRLLISLGQ